MVTKHLAFQRKKNQVLRAAEPSAPPPKLLIPLIIVDSRVVTAVVALVFVVVWIHVPSEARAQFLELVKAVAELSSR